MKKFKYFISIVLVIILSNSLAYADMVDGSSLLKSIKANDHENVKSIDGFFDGYISGVADATVNVSWCPPRELKGSQLQKIVSKYYAASPKSADEVSASAKDLVLRALTDTYPCE